MNAAHITTTAALVVHAIFLHRRQIAALLSAIAKFLDGWKDENDLPRPPLPD